MDNLAALKSGRLRGKAVQPPKIKSAPNKQDQTWTVDSSWEFISKFLLQYVTCNFRNGLESFSYLGKQADSCSSSESRLKGEITTPSNNTKGAFPSLAEQQSKLEASSTLPNNTLTIHQVLAQK